MIVPPLSYQRHRSPPRGRCGVSCLSSFAFKTFPRSRWCAAPPWNILRKFRSAALEGTSERGATLYIQLREAGATMLWLLAMAAPSGGPEAGKPRREEKYVGEADQGEEGKEEMWRE